MGIERTVTDRAKVTDEQRVEMITHTAHFEVEDEIPRPDDTLQDADEEDEEPQFLSERHVSRYRVTYAPVTKYDAQGTIVERRDELKIEYAYSDVFVRSIFKPIEVNKARFIPATTFKVENAKIVEPNGRKEIHVAELDDLVVAGLHKITSQDIQDALSLYIHGYAQNGNGHQPRE